MKKVKIPDTLIIIFSIIILFIILTYIIPSGEYKRIYDHNLKMEIIDSDSYRVLEKEPVSFLYFFVIPMKGIIKASEIFAFIIIVGAALGIIEKTKSIESGIQNLVRLAHNNKKYKNIVLSILMFFCSLCGATFGMEEEILALLIIFISLAKKLGYDSIVGVAISYVGAVIGFATGFLNPFSVQIAQQISNVPLLSGSLYRIVIWLTITFFYIIYVLRYANKIEKNPKKSVMYTHESIMDSSVIDESSEKLHFTSRRKLILAVFGLSIAALIIGSKLWGWFMEEFSGVFLFVGISSAMIYRLSLSDFIKGFVEGAKSLLYAGIVIGVARGILVVAEEGKIIDTILYNTSSLFIGTSKYISINILLAFQTFINIFIPSGSGQAALVMPIIAPLSDMIGLTRQTSILAFQFGDGFSNLIIPTSGITMGVLSIAKIPYNIWFKWIGKFLLYILVFCIIFLCLAVYMNYDSSFI